MEYEVLNRVTVKSVRVKPPTIQIFSKGQIRFSCEAAKLLSLAPKEKIELLITKEDDGIIYFRKGTNGFELQEEKTRGGRARLLLCCRPLIKKLMKHFKLRDSKTYDITDQLSDVYGDKYFFILKENVHIPVKWRPVVR